MTNWTSNSQMPFMKAEAEKAKRKYDKKNSGRKKKMIKVSDKPVTYKEVFVDEE